MNQKQSKQIFQYYSTAIGTIYYLYSNTILIKFSLTYEVYFSYWLVWRCMKHQFCYSIDDFLNNFMSQHSWELTLRWLDRLSRLVKLWPHMGHTKGFLDSSLLASSSDTLGDVFPSALASDFTWLEGPMINWEPSSLKSTCRTSLCKHKENVRSVKWVSSYWIAKVDTPKNV